MPRIRTSTSDPIDFCHECYPSEEEAERLYGDVGDGPDNRGNCFSYDDECRPSYEEVGDYECDTCGVTLTDKNA